MLYLIIACMTPEKAALEHNEYLCTYLDECQILSPFGYDTLAACRQDIPSVSEQDLTALLECNDSLLTADCSAVFTEELYITDACTTWRQTTAVPTEDQD